MTANLKPCLTVLLSLALLALAAGGAPLSAQTGEEGAAAPRVMSKEQFGAWYADQVISGMRSKGSVSPELEAKARACVLEALNQRFTEDELRKAHLEPTEAEFASYLGKLEAANTQIRGCIVN
jgi:hypothetical protein